jgi:hypothetical protein
MNKETVITILGILCTQSVVIAGGFSLIPQRPMFTENIDVVLAKVQIKPNEIEKLCLVDTGARHSVFKEAILADFPKVGETLGGGISNTNQVTDLVQVDLQVGDWNLIGAIVGRSDRIPFDCLIGNDFFLNRNFEINFDHLSVMELPEPIKFQHAFPLQVYRNDRGGHFGFKIGFAETTGYSIFDIGATSTVVDIELVRQHQKNFKLIKELEVTDGNNNKIKSGLYELDQVLIGDQVINKIEVYSLDLTNLKNKLPNVQIVLGMNVIQKYNWQFDLHNQSFQFKVR